MSRRKAFREWRGLSQEASFDLWWRFYQNGDRPKRWEDDDGFAVRCWTGRKQRGKSMFRVPYEAQIMLSELAQGPAMAEALSERTRLGPTLVRSALDVLAQIGLVQRNDRGEWALTQAGIDWLEANRPDTLPPGSGHD